MSDESERSELESQLEDARRELQALRGELATARREAALRGRKVGDGARVRLAYRSPGWDAHRRPQITVVATALDEDPDISETLASVARSRSGDWELVVVTASSSDAPLEAAERWARTNPRVPTTVIADNRALGRGAARNTGLDFARGVFLMVVDPGATIRAHCIRRLADVLSAMDEVTFVYPMIEVTGEPDWFAAAGGDHLLDTADWDPELLRHGNPVHAPYLVRTAALRDLGGFASDVGLDGFEDYDLCARIAERGGRGQLLAQVLAARSELPGAKALATIRPDDGPAIRALMARAPRTLAGAFTAAAA